MSIQDFSNLNWEIRTYHDEDIALAKQLISGQLKWKEMIALARYKNEELISYLTSGSFLLQIGLGWARYIPTVKSSSDPSPEQFGLLLASSFFRNFYFNTIFNVSKKGVYLNPKRKRLESTTAPKLPLNQVNTDFNSFSCYNPLMLPITPLSNETGTTKNSNLIPEEIISEVDRDDSILDTASIKKFADEFWKKSGRSFCTSLRKDICQIATSIFVSMHTPSDSKLNFPYDLSKDLKTLTEESVSRLKNPVYVKSIRSSGAIVDGYVFATCLSRIQDPTFRKMLDQKYDLAPSWLRNQFHSYKKVVKIWDNKAHLARLNPAIFCKVFKLSATEIEDLHKAISLLRKDYAKSNA